MAVARNLTRHRAQAKPLRGVIGGGLDAPVIQHQRLRAAAFEEQFAILGAGKRAAQDGQGLALVKMGLEGAEAVGGHWQSLIWINKRRIVARFC